MKKLFTSFVLLVVIGIMANAQDFVKVTKSNSGQTVSISANQVLEVSLPCQPSTGYGWYRTSTGNGKDMETIAQTGDWEFVPYPGKAIVGQPGEQIIRFIGMAQGTATIKLEYKRPWEKNKAAVDEYNITVLSGGKYTGSYTPPVKGQSMQRSVSSTVSSPQPSSNTGKLNTDLKGMKFENRHAPVENNNSKFNRISSTLSALPSSFSWQSKCTPIKDQAQCGSCWTFAATGVFEANINIIDGVTTSLSEQWLLDCATDVGNGCQGGDCPHHWFQYPGCVYDSDDPYIDGTCSTDYGSTATCINTCGTYPYNEAISSYADIPNQVNGVPPDSAIKRAIYNYGPVWVGIDAGSNFQNYTGGIFNLDDGTTSDHAVVLVGWDDGGGYWILRNSWGTSWGESGYMRIAYGTSVVGYYADYIVYKGGTPHTGCDTILPSSFTSCGESSMTCYYLGNSAPYVNGYCTGQNSDNFSELAQRYSAQPGTSISEVMVLYAAKIGTTGNTCAKIYSVGSDGKPDILLGTSGTITKNNIDTGFYTGVNFQNIYHFSTPVHADNDFFVSIAIPSTFTYGSDELGVISETTSCSAVDDSAGVFKWSGVWYSYYYAFGGYNIDLAIFPFPCYGSSSGINEVSAANNLLIYPNPAGDNITIAPGLKDAMISIYNIQGQLLFQQSILQTTTIDISTLAKGIYFAKVKTEKGVEMQKFVKE